MKNNWTREEVNGLLDEMFILVMDSPMKKGYEPFDIKEQLKRDKGLLPQLENGWYTQHYDKGYMMYIDFDNDKSYGIASNGTWFTGRANEEYRPSTDIKADDFEVLEALTKEAEKRGFKEGVTVSNVNELSRVRKIRSQNNDGVGWVWDTDFPNGLTLDTECIFKDGKWADIIDEPNQELEALKKKYQELGKEIENLESK